MALELIMARLAEAGPEIFAANRVDLELARKNGLPPALLKRLLFDEAKLEASLAGLAALSTLPEAVGRIVEARLLDEGLTLRRLTCPMGLIAMIFEARPDALIQMAGLAVKSGNALILKGGSEAARSNEVLSRVIAAAGEEAGLPPFWLSSIGTREEVGVLLGLEDEVDLIIPRGSKDFVKTIMARTSIPVLGHSDGVCHVYVHAEADLAMAARLAVDSKTQYPAACNAAEVLLVDRAIAARALPGLAAALEGAGVFLELCPESAAILAATASPAASAGRDASLEGPFPGEDWSVEYLDLRMAVKVVAGLEEAIAHINRYGSGHTDAIVTASRGAAERFMEEVDSSSVYWNASTRFADGYRYGLGAEVGISTGKLHARGPMGIEGLLTWKWRLEGRGQIVADYASGRRDFLHQDLPAELGTRHGE